jgi:hypothetical protein
VTKMNGPSLLRARTVRHLGRYQYYSVPCDGVVASGVPRHLAGWRSKLSLSCFGIFGVVKLRQGWPSASLPLGV